MAAGQIFAVDKTRHLCGAVGRYLLFVRFCCMLRLVKTSGKSRPLLHVVDSFLLMRFCRLNPRPLTYTKSPSKASILAYRQDYAALPEKCPQRAILGYVRPICRLRGSAVLG